MPGGNKYTKKKPQSKPGRGGLRSTVIREEGFSDRYRIQKAVEAGKLKGSVIHKSNVPQQRAARIMSSQEKAFESVSNLAKAKRDLGYAKDLPKEIRANSIKRLTKNQNRLYKAADSETKLWMDRERKTGHLYERVTSGNSERDISSRPGKKAQSLVDRIIKRIDLFEAGKKVRSPISPAATSFELGMAYLQGTKSKSQKKIKKLRKSAVST